MSESDKPLKFDPEGDKEKLLKHHEAVKAREAREAEGDGESAIQEPSVPERKKKPWWKLW
jgi:hypothetical protein